MNRDNLCSNDKSKPKIKLEKGNQVTTYDQEPTTWIPISENELPKGITNQGVLKVFEYRQVTNQGHSNDVTVIEESCIQEIKTGSTSSQTDYLIDKHKYSKEAIKPYFLNYFDLDEKSKESQDIDEYIEENSVISTITERSISRADAQVQVTPKSSTNTIEEFLRNLAEQVRLKAARIIDDPIVSEPIIKKDPANLNVFALTCENPELTVPVQPKVLKEVIICKSINSGGHQIDVNQELIFDHIYNKEIPKTPVSMSNNTKKPDDSKKPDTTKKPDNTKKLPDECLTTECLEQCGKIPQKCPDSAEKDKVKVICKDGAFKFKLNCKKVTKCPIDSCSNETKYLCKIIPQDDVCVDKKALESPTLRCSIIHPFIPEIELEEIPQQQQIKPKPFPCSHQTDDDSKTDNNNEKEALDDICSEKKDSSETNNTTDTKNKEDLDTTKLDETNKNAHPYKITCEKDNKLEEINVEIVDNPNEKKGESTDNSKDGKDPSEKDKSCPPKSGDKKDDSSVAKDNSVKEDPKKPSDTDVTNTPKVKKPCSHALKNKKESESNDKNKICPVELKNKKSFESSEEKSKKPESKEKDNSKPINEEGNTPSTPIPSAPPVPSETKIKLVIQKEEDSRCSRHEENEGKVEVKTLDKCSTEKLIFACRSKSKCKIIKDEDAEEISCVPETRQTEKIRKEERCCPHPGYLTEITNAMAAAHHKTIATIKLAAEDLVNNVASAVYKSKDDDCPPIDKMKQSASELVNELQKKAKDADFENKAENIKQTIKTGKKHIRDMEKCATDAIIDAKNKTKDFLGFNDKGKDDCSEKGKPKISPRKTSYSEDDENVELDEIVRESVEKFYDTVYKSTQEAKYVITELANQSIKVLGIEINDEEPEDNEKTENTKPPVPKMVANDAKGTNKTIKNMSVTESNKQGMALSTENIMEKVKETKEKLTETIIEHGKKLIGIDELEDLKKKKQNIKKLLSGLSIFNHIKDKESEPETESESSSLASQLSSAYDSVKSSLDALTHVQLPEKSSAYDKPTPKDVSLVPSSSAKPPGMLTSLKDKLFSIFYDKDNAINDDKESVASMEEALIIKDREDEEDGNDTKWF